MRDLIPSRIYVSVWIAVPSIPPEWHIAAIESAFPKEAAMRRRTLLRTPQADTIFRDIGAPADTGKLSVHDLVVAAEQVAVTIGVCGLVHLVF